MDSLLDELIADIRAVLGEDLIAVYLYGSYVSGGFDVGVSDLDLVAVMAGEADALDLAPIERVHAEFATRHPEWTDRIEVVYIGRDTLRSFRTSSGRLAVISPGEPLHLRDDRAAEWVQNWYLVGETGVTLFGPDPAELVPPISWAEFVEAAARYAGELSGEPLGDFGPGYLAYTVLTMCRAHMTVIGQTCGSKQEAAAWASARMPEWTWLIEAALRCRLSLGAIGFDDERTRAAATEFIGLLGARISQDPDGQRPRRTAVIARISLPASLATIREAGDPMARHDVPAHVTILFPFVAADVLDATLRDGLEEMARGHSAFVASFDRSERRDGVVWLLPADQQPFLRLTASVFERWPAYPPYEGRHDDLVAHLTLLETDDTGAVDEAVAASTEALPFDVAISELELLEEDHEDRWHRRWSVPLRPQRSDRKLRRP